MNVTTRSILAGALDGSYRDVLLRDPCVYCGYYSSQLDHIRSKAKGGSDGWENRAPSCRYCNTRKANKRLLWFLFLLARGLPKSDDAVAGTLTDSTG